MNDQALRSQVSATGFPLQLRVEREVNSTWERHRWAVSSTEHRWTDRQTGEAHFLDLVLSREDRGLLRQYMAVECKRLSGGHWVFLCPREKPRYSLAQKPYILLAGQPGQLTTPIWAQFDCGLETRRSQFCAVPGQRDNAAPMLERIAGQLLLATEALADEEPKCMCGVEGAPTFGYFIPMIVTNAELKVCDFEVGDVGMETGDLPSAGVNFEGVNWIRFEKSFATHYQTINIPMSLAESNKENQRTVFIVHAPALSAFLAEWHIG